MKKIDFFSLLFFILLSTVCGNSYSQTLAFPGAEGYGKYSTGGRGGKVVFINNLNDSGSGSFREAVMQKGSRILIFRTSGNIELQSELIITNGDLTIAGQTAPGDGICIKNYQTTINADNVILRYLRFRLGDEAKQEADALSIMNSKNIIVDHCSFSWGIDEVFSSYDNLNTTTQWCIISEALNNSYHQKGEHGYGGIWGGINAVFHHNLLAHNSSRNPRFNGARTNTSGDEELVDFSNNVIYNWGINSAYGGEGGRFNIVSNYYKSGPASKHKNRILEPFDENGKWFIKNNFVENFPEISENNWNGGIQGEYSDPGKIKSEKRFGELQFQNQSPQEAFKEILKYSGAIFPSRDKVDKRIVEEVFKGTVNSGDGIINSQKDVNGWPDLKSAEPPFDSDNDGIPDEWELKINLNPNDPEDRNKLTPDGYTYIEAYLNKLAEINP